MRILGLDIGTKRIGVAVSDETGIIAQGRGYVDRSTDKKAVEKIAELVNEENIERIVVGLPINMNGTEGERALDSRDFSALVEKEIKISVVLWDERLSTKEAEDVLIKADVSRKKRKKVVDKMAAQLILQGYLDSRVR